MSAAKADNQHWAVQAVDPPQLTDTQWYFSWVIAALLFIMAITQLIGFNDFKDSLTSFGISGSSGWAVAVILAELFAAMGFLKIRLSYGFRLFSAALAVLVGGFWFIETMQAFGNGNAMGVSNTGYFGSYLVQASGWWTAIEVIVFLFWIVYAVELTRLSMSLIRASGSNSNTKSVSSASSTKSKTKRATTKKPSTRRKR